jgi:hypothetical protein
METKQSTIRKVLFAVFFTVGATVACLAALAGDLMEYYSSKQQLVWTQRRVELLEQLNADYEALLDQVHQDPNLVKRTAPAILGTWPQEPNTAHPAARPEELLAAQQTLFVAEQPREERPAVPEWVVRCNRPAYRWALFLSGAGLVAVAFICFGPQRPVREKSRGRCSASADLPARAPSAGPLPGESDYSASVIQEEGPQD